MVNFVCLNIYITSKHMKNDAQIFYMILKWSDPGTFPFENYPYWCNLNDMSFGINDVYIANTQVYICVCQGSCIYRGNFIDGFTKILQ